MLNRINWGSQANEDNGEVKMDQEAKVTVDGECILVWEGGSIAQPSTAKKWKVVDIRSEHEARRILAERNYGHLWQHVLTFTKMRAGQDQGI